MKKQKRELKDEWRNGLMILAFGFAFILLCLIIISIKGIDKDCLQEIAEVECMDNGLVLEGITYNTDFQSWTYTCSIPNQKQDMLIKYKFKDSDVEYCK